MCKIRYFLPIFLLCFFACSPNPTESGAEYDIVVDLDKSVEQFDFSTLLDDASAPEIIRLETNDDCLIGEATKIFFRKDAIFVFDEMSKSVVVFNRDGTHRHTVRHIGRAANEYLDVYDVYVSDETIFVYDMVGQKIVCYDLAGQYQKTVDVSKYWAHHLFGKDGKLYLINHWSGSQEGRYRIFVLDMDGNLLKKELPFEEQEKEYGFSGNRYALFSDSADVNFGNTIYRLSDNDRPTPRYRIDFGDKTSPTSNSPFELSKAVEAGLHKKYIFGLENMYESGRYLLFNFFHVQENYTAIYDKQEGSLTVAEGLSIESFLGIGPGIYFIENDDMYSYYAANDILMVDKYNWSVSSHVDTENYRRMKAKIAGMTEMDNGVIIKYRLKSDEN